MSTEAPNVFDIMRAIRSSDLDSASKLLLLEIMDRAGNGKGVCTASAATLAKGVGFSPRYAKTLIYGLAENGWIVVERVGESVNSPRRRITLAPKVSLEHMRRQASNCDPQITLGISPTVIHRSGNCDPQITPTVIPRSHERLSERQKETSVSRTDRDGNPSCSEGGGGPDGEGGALDKAKIVELASRCSHLPRETSEKLASRGDLSKRIDGDWEALALALVKTELGRASGEIDVIKQPTAYLLKVAASLRDGEDPGPKVRMRLKAMLEGKPDPTAPGDSERERRIDQAMNSAAVRGAIYRKWNALADQGFSVQSIEATIENEMRMTNDALKLLPWQTAQREQVAREFFAKRRAPVEDLIGEPDDASEFVPLEA